MRTVINEVQTRELTTELQSSGWSVVQSVIRGNLLDSLCDELAPALRRREMIRQQNGVEGKNDGTLHHLLMDHPVFRELLDELEPFDPIFRWYFAGNCILNSYGGVVNQADSIAYVHQVHRDIRFSSDTKRFMLNLLVMLDDFTLENGATHLLSGSQRMVDKPTDELFFERADRAVGPRGSLLFFDSRLWHATGRNLTGQPRRALTCTFTSPFFKQQLDYCRLMGYAAADSLTPFTRQIVGFNARVPATLEEYYRPVDERFYKRGQDD